MEQCQKAFPRHQFALKIVKTTGDKLQTASMAQEGKTLPKGLFTKELEVALLEGKAELAVHSLKDLPTELPTGLKVGAVLQRADVRDLLVYKQEGHSSMRGFPAGLRIDQLPPDTVIATSNTRRRAQLLAQNSCIKVVEIRGNVLTRLTRISEKEELDGTVLAFAGLERLGYHITKGGLLRGENVPAGLFATLLETDVMLPCVGQGAIAIEIRENDECMSDICEAVNHFNTLQSVTAERTFLAGMGGGCQSPVAAFAEVAGQELRMRALSFAAGRARYAEGRRPMMEARALGEQLAARLKV